MTTLLEKAKTKKRKRRAKLIPTRQDVDLALAYLEGKVNLSQVAHAKSWYKDSERGRVYVYVAMALQYAIEQGLIKIERTNDKT